MKIFSWTRWLKVALMSLALFGASAAHAEKIRLGYWTSGVSLGFGAVLEAGNFFKQAGVDVEFVRFADVNATTRALAANAIDIAFGAPAAGVFGTVADGVPIRIVAATQPADVLFVVPIDSPIKSLNELRGKKIGMSPEGSSVASLAKAILAGNHNIKAHDFTLVPGNEARLAQFLLQKQVDAAALRSVTLAQLQDLKVRRLGSFASEWATLTHSNAVPYIGVAAVRNDALAQHPDDIARVLSAMHQALLWGRTHHAEVAAILQKSANLPAADAKAYADLWDNMNRVSFEAVDIDTLKREHQLFVDEGILRGSLPDGLFDREPYLKSKSLK